MKICKIILMVFIELLIDSSVLGQKISIPHWINGTWHNSNESDTENFEYWTFINDSIYVIKGLPINKSKRICLNEKYSDYKINSSTNDSLFRLEFIKDEEQILYEFKLLDVGYSENPVLTYSILIDGAIKRQHTTSCNLVLTK
jgi:hypothetical protein